jgi:nitrogen fixation protein FixH
VPSEWRREPWPFLLAGLLLAMMGGSLAFLAVASAHPDPLVADDTWRAGSRYNEALRQQQRAEALGLELQLEVQPAADGVQVAAEVLDADGAAVGVDRLVVRRERPAEGGFDADFELPGQQGRHAGAIPLPRAGRWRLVVTAEHADARLRRVLPVRR